VAIATAATAASSSNRGGGGHDPPWVLTVHDPIGAPCGFILSVEVRFGKRRCGVLRGVAALGIR
jgi:hypothetical protein